MKKLFNQETYTINELIGLLLPKLYRNGIKEIYEEELARKLYYYSINLEFKDLFINIPKVENEDKIDIKKAIYYEKCSSEGVKWSVSQPEKIFLSYSDYLDILPREKKLTEEGLELINKMVEELTLIYKVESISKNKLTIYNVNPNQEYILVYGNNLGKIISSELVTDGCINHLSDKSYLEDRVLENPCKNGNVVSLSNTKIRNIKVRHANYVAMVGTKDNNIKNINVYTNITDINELNKISEVVINNDKEENLLTTNKPYVRKIVL